MKVDAPLSSTDVKFLLNQMREGPLVIASFLWASIVLHRLSKLMSAKETVSLHNGENIEMLVCFICMRTQDRSEFSSKYDKDHSKLQQSYKLILVYSRFVINSQCRRWEVIELNPVLEEITCKQEIINIKINRCPWLSAHFPLNKKTGQSNSKIML